MTRRIVACGGQQLYHPALTRYVLELTERSHPKILFLPTASGEDPAYLLTFYQQLAGVDCAPSHLALLHRTVADVEHLIRAHDVIMVGGGNTANMLAIFPPPTIITPCARLRCSTSATGRRAPQRQPP